MLRVIAHKSAAAARKYYSEGLAREDYYSEKQEIAGNWYGKGAERLGLSGPVSQEAFAALVENQNPVTGKRLTARTNVDRRVGYDLNFHAPKSLSILHALTGDKKLLAAFRSAVAETMTEIEIAAATRIRRSRSDAERFTGNLVWSEFIHLTARPVGGVPDPHLHAHCFAFNATYDDVESRWKAASWAGIKKDASYYEAAFHSRLTEKIVGLGYGIQRTRKGWEIAGVSRSIIERFSRRSAEIDRMAAEKGITDAHEKDALGAASRERKRHGDKYSNLVAEWKNRLSPEERLELRRAAYAPESFPPPEKITVTRAVEEATEKLFAKDSVVDVKRLVAEALRFGSGQVSPSAVWKEIAKGDFIVREVGGQSLCTTTEILGEEIALINFVRSGRGMHAPFLNKLPSIGDGPLSEGQFAAAVHLWTNTDKVMAIRGGAGVGKTTLMSEAVRRIEETGVKVFAFAQSTDATDNLRKEGFSDAQTIAHLLINPKLQKAVRGNVIWIDEAGLVGIRDMWEILQIAGKDARVILTGDTAQHRPVARGDSMDLIQSYAGLKIAHVFKVRRQLDVEYRKAVEFLSRGDLQTAFRQLDDLGAIVEIDDDRKRYRALAADFLNLSRKDYAPLVVSPTHREGAAVTGCIREAKKDAGQLGKELPFVRYQSLRWEEPDRRRVENYDSGLVVQFNQNAKGFVRGSIFNVTGRDDSGRVWIEDAAGRKKQLPLNDAMKFDVYEKSTFALAVGDRLRITKNGPSADGRRLNNGGLFTVEKFNRKGQAVLNTGAVLNPDHGHLTYGYCQTSHSSQSRTVRDVLIAQSADSFLASSREQFYVSVSRGQKSVRIYTDDRQALQTAVGNSSQRLSGVGFVGLSRDAISLPMSDDKGPTYWTSRYGKRPAEGEKKWTDQFKKIGQASIEGHIKKIETERQTTGPDKSYDEMEKRRLNAPRSSGLSRFRAGPKIKIKEGAKKGGLSDSKGVEIKSEKKPDSKPQPAKVKPTTQKQRRAEKLIKASRRSFKTVTTRFKGAAKGAAKTVKAKTKLAATSVKKAAKNRVQRIIKSRAKAPKPAPPAPRIKK